MHEHVYGRSLYGMALSWHGIVMATFQGRALSNQAIDSPPLV